MAIALGIARPHFAYAETPPADTVGKARALAKWGDRAGALRVLAAHLQVEPADVVARTLYGTMLARDGRADEARTELDAALASDPRSPSARLALVKLELSLAHGERAHELATEGLARDPNDGELRLARAQASLMQWRFDDAAADLDKLPSSEPPDSAVQHLRTRVHEAQEREKGLGHASLTGAVPIVLELVALVGARPAFDTNDADPPTDLLANARALSSRGDRAGALRLLEWHLEAKPSDTDARTLYGTILSWEGRYDEARSALAEVLRASPGHYDATRAALRVELWSDHPERAEDMATRALAHDGDAIDFLLARARARYARNDLDGALEDLGRILALDPANQEALRLQKRIEAAKRVWSVGSSYTYDAFSDGRTPWHEGVLRLKRGTPLGSVIMRGYQAWRFDTSDRQFELEAYPRIREGTYADVGGAVSPNAELYPHYRVQLDVYQSLPLGFEASLGYRHLQFSSGVDMAVVTVGKYLGDWFFTARSFITPGVAGASVSGSGAVRRYFLDGAAYVGLRYGHGVSKEELRNVNDIALLASNTGAAEAFVVLGDRIELGLSGAVSQERRVDRDDLWQYDLGTSVGFRF